jgi:hypothetical protein
MPSNLQRRLTRLEDRLDDRDLDADMRERRKRLDAQNAYEAGHLGECLRMAGRCRELLRAATTGDTAKSELDRLAEEVLDAQHALEQRVDGWLAEGAPGAPEWYRPSPHAWR